MKIILDNIIYSKGKNGGISNYWYELTCFLLKQSNIDISFFDSPKGEINFHRQQLPIQFENILKDNVLLDRLARLLNVKYKSNEKFIYHSSYYRGLSGSKNSIEVTTVHDFIHSFYAPFINKTLHNNLKFNAIRRSKGVICISSNTYTDLQRFCPINKNQKVEVIYNGVSDEYRPLDIFNINQKIFLNKNKLENDFLLFVGGRTNYKNFDYVASILNQNRELKLVIVGGGFLTKNEIKLFTKDSWERLIFIDSVTNDELNVLYNRAFALIYPSGYEGFGIPMVEAMRAGCPVIALDIPIVREIAQNSAILLNELTIANFNAIKENLVTNDFRKEIIEKGLLESQKYSWKKCCRETFEFYQSLY
jgi:mannosyltransferase